MDDDTVFENQCPNYIGNRPILQKLIQLSFLNKRGFPSDLKELDNMEYEGLLHIIGSLDRCERKTKEAAEKEIEAKQQDALDRAKAGR